MKILNYFQVIIMNTKGERGSKKLKIMVKYLLDCPLAGVEAKKVRGKKEKYK